MEAADGRTDRLAEKKFALAGGGTLICPILTSGGHGADIYCQGTKVLTLPLNGILCFVFTEFTALKAEIPMSPPHNPFCLYFPGSTIYQKVKDAWMDAAKEVNANGMGIRGNGMMSHISQMMVQRLNKQLKGETENFDILGSTVESAIQATKNALYDLEHPRVYTPRSIEVQQARIKEGEFYRAFLEKLEKL